MDEELESFLDSLNQASSTEFPVQGYVAKLTAAGLTTATGAKIKNSLSSTVVMADATFNGVDCGEDAGNLLASSAARGAGNVQDSFGFHRCVNKDIALRVARSSLANLMPRIYGDFLVKLLSKSKHDIAQLAKNSDFVKAYQAKIQDKDFIVSQVIAKSVSATSFPNYFLNIFFINEYFRHQGDFVVNLALPQSPSSFHTLVSDYHESLKNKSESDDVAYGCRLAHIISAVSHIFAPGHSLDHDVTALTKAVFPSDAGSETEPVKVVQAYVASEASETLESLGSRMWTAWDNETQTFTDAMKNLANKGVTKIAESYDNGYSRQRTEYGQDLADFISFCRKSEQHQNLNLFVSDPPAMDKRSKEEDLWNTNSQHWYDGGGCFVAGTQVMTYPGQSISIDLIKEGTVILTRADTSEYGFASDERVEMPLGDQEVTLFGFNDESPFFTANHVFRTTGGLRALDPPGAMRENAHLEVGHLRIGDVLLRTSDGRRYDPVPISSITRQRISEKYVYGVHLREGLRSYHANGYLVYLNYPEITLASIGRSLLALDQAQQVQALASLQELQPLLQRFGGPVVLDALHKQLAENASRPHRSAYLAPQRKGTLLDADMSFDLAPKTPSVRALPTLILHRGLFQAGGEACTGYSLQSNSISWSRLIDGETVWEHGCCQVLLDWSGGGGIVIYSEHAVPTKSDWGEAIQVSCTARSRVHATVEPQPMLHAQRVSKTSVSRPRDPEVSASVAGLIETRPTFSALAAAEVPAVRNSAGGVASGSPLVQSFDLSVDTTTLPSIDPMQAIQPATLQSPTKLLQLGVRPGGLDLGAPRFDFVIPALDSLRDAAIQHMSKKLAEKPGDDVETDIAKMSRDIPSIYDSCTYSKDGKTRVSVRMTYPGFLAHAADVNIDKPENSKDVVFKDLTFGTLLGTGSTLQLPFVFSNMELEYGPGGDTLRGYAWEYDPQSPGDMGAMHAVNGVIGSPTVPQTILAAKQSTASFSSTAAPAVPSMMLFKSGTFVPDVSWLKALRIDNQGMKDAAQRTIYKAMLYYMSDANLKDFVGENRPGVSDSENDLPPLFANSLEKETKEWLINKYTPAWVALRVIQTSDVAKETWKVKFSAQDAKKVLYFWRGKGAGCLSKSGHYAKLNDLAVRVATLRQNPNLNDFLSDGEADEEGRTGGPKWAASLFAVLTQATELRNMIMQMQILQSNNILQNYCNILHILQPLPLEESPSQKSGGKKPPTPSALLATAVMADPLFAMMKMQYICSDELGEASVFQDVMKHFMDMLLSDDPVFSGDMQKALKLDLDNSTDIKIKDRATTWLHLETALSQSSSYAKYLRLIGTYKGVSATAPGLSVARRLQVSADMLFGQNKLPLPLAGDVNMAGLRRVLILAGVVYLNIFVMSSLVNWKKMSPTQKGMAITNSIQGLLGPLRTTVNLFGSLDGWAGRLVPQFMRDLAAASVEFRAVSMANSVNEYTWRYMGFYELGQHPAVAGDPRAHIDRVNRMIDPDYAGPRFNWRANWFRVATCVLNLALCILMGIQLFSNWSDRPLVDSILDTIVWVTIVLSVIADAIILLSLAGVAIWTSVLAICAWLAPLLVVVGIVVALVAFAVAPIRGPPLSPLEKWVEHSGGDFVKTLGDPPKSRLDWSWGKPEGGRFDITGRNSGDGSRSLASVEFSFASGGSDGTLFTGNGPFAVGAAPGRANTVAVASSSLPAGTRLNLTVNQGSVQQGITATSSTVIQWLVRLDAAGKDVIVPAGGSVTLSPTGSVNMSGKVSVIVAETFMTDGNSVDGTDNPLVLSGSG